MNTKLFCSIGAISLAAGVLGAVNPAEAAALQGGVDFSPRVGFGNGLTLTGTGLFAPNGSPLTDVDFTLPANSGIGIIVTSNAGTPPPLDFVPFIGDLVTIQDLNAPRPPSPNTQNPTASIFPSFGNPPVSNFIVNPGKFILTLDSVSDPVYFETPSPGGGVSTTVSISGRSRAINLSDGSNDVSFGDITFSADFAGRTAAQTRSLFDTPGETFGPSNWSGNGIYTAPAGVPEPSALAGLLALGLTGGTLIRRKQK